MKLMLKTCFFLLSLFGVNDLYAQQSKGVVVKGIVINAEDRQPLEGATVTAKGSKERTGTMPDGSFSIEVPEGITILVVTAEGFEEQEVKFGSKRDITIKLKLRSSIINGTDLYITPKTNEITEHYHY